MLFRYLLKSIVYKGSLELITANGKTHSYGDGKPPHVVIKLHRGESLEWSLGINPDLKIGEAYMDGLLTIEEGDLYDFLYLLLSNYKETGDRSIFHWSEHLHRYLKWLDPFNPIERARQNVAYHYDMPDELYDLFLDADRQYSCAYFTRPDNTLEQAQLDKKRHIASKLLLNQPGLNVLDIGSGWGGLGIYLARETGSHVTGVTLSVNQYDISCKRAWREGLSKACQFALRDYRQETGPYDRIVSVGMFEHVGRKNYDEFFRQVRRLLAEDGICLLHAIGRFGEPQPVNAYIRKHIFPGTDIATLPEVLEPIGRSGLFITDVEILRLHYAETLRHWARRFRLHRAKIVGLYGERLYRKWEFYLIGCETAFRLGNLMVFQIQLSKRLETVPQTRDYMYDRDQSQGGALRALSISA